MLLSFKTVYATVMVYSSTFSQSLYESENFVDNDFFRNSKRIMMQSLLEKEEALLKETKYQLLKYRAKEYNLLKSYSSLMKMINKGKLPNDLTIDEICASQPNLIIKSQIECHRYYNCSSANSSQNNWQWNQELPFWLSKYKYECRYPYLFSEETLRCENYTIVKCGSRYEAKWECEYKQYQYECRSPSCIPCDLSFHSCYNLPNGIWPFPERPNYITYIKCENYRKIDAGACSIDSLWGVQTFPFMGQCVQLFAIPKSYNPNGELPSCTEKDDGNYQFPVRYCNGYYVCKNGFASAVKCPNNTVFDSVKKICKADGHCVH
ncbi:uncharacterized protein LOC144617818 [Crassostrea virginica]